MTNGNGNSRLLLAVVGILATALIFTVGYIISQKTVYGDLGAIQLQTNAHAQQLERHEVQITNTDKNIEEIKERLNKIDIKTDEMYKSIINIERKSVNH